MYLVSTFKLAVVFVALLNGVVGQVDEPVVDIFDREVLAGCAQIPVLVEVASHIPIRAGDHRVTSDVEFTSVEEQRSVDVFLDDVGAFGAVREFDVRDELLDVQQIPSHNDPEASVRVLAWLHYP